jgi:hypothetical protein
VTAEPATDADLSAQPPRSGGGGFTVSCADTSTRPVLTRAAISAFMPTQRGAFTFPAPYNTQAIRVTCWLDGDVLPVGYAYWRRINMHRDRGELRVLVSRRQGSALIVTVDKATLACSAMELEDVYGTGEMWYWDAVDPDVFYLLESGALLRYNVATRARQTVVRLDGLELWQPHSSADGRAHSATVKTPDYRIVHAVVGYPSWQRVLDINAGAFDECQIDKTGRYLVIKEGQDNRILDIESGGEWFLTNQAGAWGHSDNGPGYGVGENDYHALPGAFEYRDLGDFIGSGRLVYHTTDWQAMARYVSIAWDRPVPLGIYSSSCRVNVPRANEIVVADLAGSLQATVIAPTLVDFDAMGGGDDYSKAAKANADPMGEWVCWSANWGSDRMDLFLVKVPPR